MASRPPTPDLAGALAAMRKADRRRGRPSPVHHWLEANYDGLAAAFRREPPSWTNLAAYLGEHGVTGVEGRRLSPAAVRAAWVRVDKARRRRRSTARSAEMSDPQLPERNGSGDDYDFGETPFVR
jgi:hypothetical protein